MKLSLKAARVNAGLLQREVADDLGVSRTIVIRWEAGKVKPKDAHLDQMLTLYGVSRDDIFLPTAST